MCRTRNSGRTAGLALLVIAAAILAGCATQPTARSATRKVYGTWVNTEYDGHAEADLTVAVGGSSFRIYPGKLILEGDPDQPMLWVFETSTEKQTDFVGAVTPIEYRVEDDGSIFHKFDCTIVDLGGLVSGKGISGVRFFMPLRISAEEDRIEFNVLPAHDRPASPGDFPSAVNPDGDSYHTYVRS